MVPQALPTVWRVYHTLGETSWPSRAIFSSSAREKSGEGELYVSLR